MKIAMNGCFDCLHAGHKHMVNFAIRLAGIHGEVIFLINSDRSVRELKGPGRPLQNINDRMEALEGYWFVRQQYYGGSQYMPAARYDNFDSEEELEAALDNLSDIIILKGDDRPDTREIMGHKNHPICILPRLKDSSSGELLSTTRMLSNDRDNVVQEDSTPF